MNALVKQIPKLRRLPRSIPRKNPAELPLPLPEKTKFDVLLRFLGFGATCPLNGKDKVSFPHKKDSPNPRNTKRQRPCKGGARPIVLRRTVTEYVGTFVVKPGDYRDEVSVPATETKEYKDFLERKGITRKGKTKIFIEGVNPLDLNERDVKQLLEQLDAKTVSGLIRGKLYACVFRVFKLRERRVCRCPDGHPCRKTRISL